jgi:hypothetical protein
MRKLILSFILTLFVISTSYSQTDSALYGDALKKIGQNYFNFSNPSTENFEVYVWGGVKNPGIYLIPVGTDLIKLITLTGGAPDDRMYESFKLIRPKTRTGNMKTDSAFVFNYQDFFDSEKKGSFQKNNPELKAGDILIFPLRPEKDFWDTATRISSLLVLPLLTMISIALQIRNLSR